MYKEEKEAILKRKAKELDDLDNFADLLRPEQRYIDLLPCNNNNNEIHVECYSHSIPEKILDKLYDLTKAGLIVKE